MRNYLGKLTVQMPFCQGTVKLFKIMRVDTNIAVWLHKQQKTQTGYKDIH